MLNFELRKESYRFPNYKKQKRSFCTLIKNSKLKIKIKFPGDNGGGETPVPIPNTAVKPSCADGTAEFLWKSRTLPGFNYFLPT
jgi:hypothetical protein